MHGADSIWHQSLIRDQNTRRAQETADGSPRPRTVFAGKRSPMSDGWKRNQTLVTFSSRSSPLTFDVRRPGSFGTITDQSTFVPYRPNATVDGPSVTCSRLPTSSSNDARSHTSSASHVV